MLHQGLTQRDLLAGPGPQKWRSEVQTVSLGEAQPQITVSCCLEHLEQAVGAVWGAVGSLFAQANRPVAIATLIVIVLQFV